MRERSNRRTGAITLTTAAAAAAAAATTTTTTTKPHHTSARTQTTHAPDHRAKRLVKRGAQVGFELCSHLEQRNVNAVVVVSQLVWA